MFFIKQNDAKPQTFPKGALSQTGRASMEVLGSMQKLSSSLLRDRARENFAADPDGAALNALGMQANDIDVVAERVERAKEIALRDPVHRLERFYQRYVSEEVYHKGIPATEERRAQFEPLVKETPPSAGGTLELNPDIKLPDYYEGVEFHLRPGGWDGYDLYGPYGAYSVGPLVFKHGGYSAVPKGGDIQAQRLQFAQQLPKKSYGRIYEPGCGSCTTMFWIHKVFPEAELVGSDLSPLVLNMGFQAAERSGMAVHLKQVDAVHSGEPDESFDAVVTYALHHELPVSDNIELFKEMFRILKPGGDILMSDPPPFRAVEPFQSVILDWDNDHKEEPYFTETCLANWDEELRKVGFVNVQSYALGPDSYPWVTRASKPV
jgi:SAM-dependent methyltransferase